MSKEVKIAATSDLHGELNFKVPVVDILTISGDICPVKGSHNPIAQMHWLNEYFLPWCDNLVKSNNVKHVVFIAGNHDFVFKKVVKHQPESIFNFILPANVYYLCDSGVMLEGIKIYGTPWTPTFGNWAYMHGEQILDGIFDKIPNGLDILLTHGPAHGYNDTILQYASRSAEHLGSTMLAKHIARALPKWVFCGHIHSGNHNVEKMPISLMDNVKLVNVSLLDEDYNIAYKPFETIIQVS